MAGRPKQKCYQYNSKGKFIKEFESTHDAVRAFYPTDKGIRPIFRTTNGQGKIYDKNYHILPNGDFITKNKIGRVGIRNLMNRINNPFIELDDTRVIEVYNIDNKKIAEFANYYIASKLTNVPAPTICGQLKSTRPSISKILTFKYKK